MSPRKAKKLIRDFPNIFHCVDSPYPFNMFGLEVGDGWEPLLRRLAKQLSSLVDKEFYVTQVKEKFGGLRFYISGGSNKVYEVIDAAEQESFKVCEVCSRPGCVRGVSWYYTSCEEHKREDK